MGRRKDSLSGVEISTTNSTRRFVVAAREAIVPTGRMAVEDEKEKQLKMEKQLEMEKQLKMEKQLEMEEQLEAEKQLGDELQKWIPFNATIHESCSASIPRSIMHFLMSLVDCSPIRLGIQTSVLAVPLQTDSSIHRKIILPQGQKANG